MLLRTFAASIGLVIVLSSVATAAPLTLCKPEEIAVFSCDIGKKVISICASADLTEKSGYLQYRFGKVGKLTELEYPPINQHPKTIFSLAAMGGTNWSSEQLFFINGEYHYAVFVERSGNNPIYSNYQGIVIRKDGKMVSHLLCKSSPDPDNLNSLSKAGIPIIEWDEDILDINSANFQRNHY